MKYWENCGVSEPGVIVIMKLQKEIKATQHALTPNPSPHVPGNDIIINMNTNCIDSDLKKIDTYLSIYGFNPSSGMMLSVHYNYRPIIQYNLYLS